MSIEPLQWEVRNMRDSGFFVLRTPGLPMEELTRWSLNLEAPKVSDPAVARMEAYEAAWAGDLQTLRGRLRAIVSRPEIAHALFVASPALRIGIEHWMRDPDSKKGLQAERALVRYFERMCTRPTPFGLFSGCSVGQVQRDSPAPTAIVLQSRHNYRLHSRLDFDYLFALTTALQRDPELSKQQRYWPNSSLCRIGEVWNYIESRLATDQRTHHLVRIENDVYMEKALECAKQGASLAELSQAILLLNDPDVSTEDAQAYIQELINNDVLVSSLSPTVTGRSALDDIIVQLDNLSSGTAIADSLRSARDGLAELDKRGIGVDVEEYHKVTTILEGLPAKIDLGRLYQVDMIKPVEHAVLTKVVVDEMLRGVDVLCRLSETGEQEALSSFREAFSERYEGAMIPLLEALDEETGIGFDRPSTDNSALLRGLDLVAKRRERGGPEIPRLHSFLLQKLVDCLREGKTELKLNFSDLPLAENTYRSLPNALLVNATLVASSMDAVATGDFRLLIGGMAGPSGATLLGRFCHLDAELEVHVRHHMRQEEAHDPDAIYAEIVHLPEGWIGNVLCRPVLRDYELIYLGRSGAPQDRQVLVSDLLVAVEGKRIILYSRSLGRRVIPRLTNAHGYRNRRLAPAYRFLCCLQHENGVSAPNFVWGPLETLKFLPRVSIGRLVLTTARWILEKEDILNFSKQTGGRRFLAVQEFRRNNSLPRWVDLVDGDRSLIVDLDNVLSVDAFVHVLKRTSIAILRETYPSPEQLCVTGPEGHFSHELNVPLIRIPQNESPDLSIRPVNNSLNNNSPENRIRHLPLGSEWLYVKLYGGAISLDEVLITAMAPLLERAAISGCITRWFFIRYADPKPHLRIRFQGEPDLLRGELFAMLMDVLEPLLARGVIWKIQYDTYSREIERYGGLAGVRAAEEIFAADSDAVLALLPIVYGDDRGDLRWQIALLGVDRLISDFGFDLMAKRGLVEHLRDSQYGRFERVTAKKGLADRFRAERRRLEVLLHQLPGASEHAEFARSVFLRRSIRVKEVFRQLRALAENGELKVKIPTLVGSYVHMHINRLARSSANQHELVLYEFLWRLYDGELSHSPSARLGQRLSQPLDNMPLT